MKQGDLAQFTEAHAAGRITVDVREPGEYVAGHVPRGCLPKALRNPGRAKQAGEKPYGCSGCSPG